MAPISSPRSITPVRWCSAAATSSCRCSRPPSSTAAGSRRETFLAGYGIAQALPGPLFTFAAFLGAAKGRCRTGSPEGSSPSSRSSCPASSCHRGAAVLARPAAERGRPHGACGRERGRRRAPRRRLYDPLWTSAVHGPRDAAVGARLVRAPGFVEGAALARRRARRRSGDRRRGVIHMSCLRMLRRSLCRVPAKAWNSSSSTSSNSGRTCRRASARSPRRRRGRLRSG